jgi:hypothetical protein
MTTYREKTPATHGKSGKTTTHERRYVTRDARTGRFVQQQSKQEGGEPSTANQKASGQHVRPDTFIKEFTKHPVVDRVMRRLPK